MLLIIVLTPLLLLINGWALSPLGCLKRLEAMEYQSAIVYCEKNDLTEALNSYQRAVELYRDI